MKMVKSLLLGSAAGLVAMAGAQAADLPVKAKPVQYVKICSLYGAGFYYIPGTDMCLKIGGWVRAEYMYNMSGSTVTTMNGDVNNRGTQNSIWRTRGYITADARNQSEYGTIRSYIAVGLSTTSTGQDSAGNQFDANRAFIQFAGFTFGKTQSFFDFYSGPAPSFFGNYPSSDTGDPGWQTLAYTAQFGNGLSASLSLEQRRMTQIINVQGVAAFGGAALNGAAGGVGTIAGSFGTSGTPTAAASSVNGAYGGNSAPDVVGNVRVDQPWGSAQLMGALHEVNATYYVNPALTFANSTTALENSGHPSDVWGFVVAAGLKLNAPMIGAGDYFQTQVNYTQGALRYIFFNPNGNYYVQQGQKAGFGVLSDSVYGGTVAAGTASGNNLTTAWNVNASYEHFWNKQWRTSAYGGYAAVSYNTQANAMLCIAQGTPGVGSTSGTGAIAAAGCNNNWSTWWLGSRTQWNITPDTYMGLDIVYLSLHSAGTPTGLLNGATQIPTTTATNVGVVQSTMSNWAGRFRVHRDFYP
jgi:Porin subfamily